MLEFIYTHTHIYIQSLSVAQPPTFSCSCHFVCFGAKASGDMQALLADSTVTHLWDDSGLHMRQLEEQAALKQLLTASNAGEPAAAARLDALTKVMPAAKPGPSAATPGFWVPHMSFLYKLDDAPLAALMLLIICLLTLFCSVARIAVLPEGSYRAHPTANLWQLVTAIRPRCHKDMPAH